MVSVQTLLRRIDRAKVQIQGIPSYWQQLETPPLRAQRLVLERQG